ncbi:MAG: hypothetical protein F6K40_09230 [Okeania sp. SIO3I5]|uniref:hypothetical protein n=1 Tax=Okeania sp. SIO3I5 TaxID=2607805 RepID=UPI0013BBEC8B|nr:hypothetical protein [Okeania sp. SIO3I5]NEQ36446.1 hypothetical protein [Okeania sp. SIO3I5]
MNNENKQNQTNKIDSFLGRRIIDQLLALKEEMTGRIEEIIALIEQNFDRRLENAILFLAGSGDGENLEDSIGFNESDSRFGHSLAMYLQSGAMLTVKQAQTALQMMQKYTKTQLEPNGYSLPTTWEEISHQYRERTIEIDPSRLRLGLHKDEGHDTCIAIYYPDNVEVATIEEGLEESAGIEDGERWPVLSGNWDYGYPLWRAEGLVAAARHLIESGYNAGYNFYIDPDIEAAYYLWQEKQKAKIGSGISVSFSRSATSSESSSNDTVDPTGDVPLEMVRNVLQPGDYSGVWHGHAVKFLIQEIFPTGEFNGVGEFVGGPHNGIKFGFTGKVDFDGRLTISRDVGIGSQVASNANFEIDGDSIVWQGLTKGPGIGDAGLPFEFLAQS